ncbi:hypothetical protein SBP18_15515 [Rhodoferax ferrireducens]|uniref:hypothetical protein n=1 Tax=Rhodoferax ferrireducens TaxID=192843 RepID=UPI00298E0F19|nr:hypothetical protein [Rhodoferax ferrireducens]WPC65889.1 hypothetical protein SBP18_15515 [Rhodoferax ferrireducens]
MKKLLMLTLLGMSLAAGSVFAADVAPAKAAIPAKAVKVAKVTGKTITTAEKGRYHAVHESKAKLECSDCHGGGADDILFVRTGEFQGREGPVDRKECLTCHQTPKKPTFYGAAR